MKPLWLALGFLTRLPVPTPEVEEREFGLAVLYFPAVGALLGAGIAGLGWALQGRAPMVVGALAVAALALVSGGLHLDGLADSFDGLGVAGRPDPAARRARMLEVMRDSRIGALGAIALFLGLILKTLALGPVTDLRVWVLAPALGRLMPGLLMRIFPYARPEGLGRLFHNGVRSWHVALSALPVLALAVWTGAWIPLAVGLVAALLLAWRMNRHLGGLTGDVYGAAIELAETGALVCAALLSTG